MSTPQPQSQDQIALLVFRVEALERTVSGFNQQLSSYVRERENDLNLKMLQNAALHIGEEVSTVRSDMRALGDEVKTLKDDLQKRDAAQHEGQSQLQIRALVAILSAIAIVVTGWLVAFLTHWIH